MLTAVVYTRGFVARKRDEAGGVRPSVGTPDKSPQFRHGKVTVGTLFGWNALAKTLTAKSTLRLIRCDGPRRSPHLAADSSKTISVNFPGPDDQ